MTFQKIDVHDKPGISGPIMEEDSGNRGVRWKRCDGFGHMTDEQVRQYKAARPRRYMAETIDVLIDRIRALEGVA